jgi:hypothetical protein
MTSQPLVLRNLLAIFPLILVHIYFTFAQDYPYSINTEEEKEKEKAAANYCATFVLVLIAVFFSVQLKKYIARTAWLQKLLYGSNYSNENLPRSGFIVTTRESCGFPPSYTSSENVNNISSTACGNERSAMPANNSNNEYVALHVSDIQTVRIGRQSRISDEILLRIDDVH